MPRPFKQTLLSAYAFAIIALCLLMSSAMFVLGWQRRTHGRSDTIFSLVVGGFFLYAVIVLLFQRIEDRKYKRAFDALGFVPFDWAKVPFQQVLSVFSKGRKAFVSRGFQGRIGGTDIYVFNFGTDTAWWGMRRVAAVLPNVSKIEHPKGHELLMKNAGAELAVTAEWFVVRSRRRVSPDAFQQWVKTVVNTLASS
jgi:hypothetical protein